MNRAWRILAWLLTALALDARAAGAPIVRTRIAPATVTIGQPVTLSIDVLVPTWFAGAIDYPPAFNVPDAVAKLSDERAVNLNERIGGESYAGMTRTYVIVPQKAGSFAVPPVALRVPFAVDGKTVVADVKTTPQQFEARLPAGAEDLGYFISTRSYRLTQQVEPASTQLKVGDAVTRAITQRATDLAPMFLPALHFDAVEGLELYPAEPVLAEKAGERGAPGVATRTDAVTYVLAKPGQYRLPGISIAWFDPGQAGMRRAEVKELVLDVAPLPATGDAAQITPVSPPSPPSRFASLAGRWREILAATLSLALAGLAIWRLFPLVPTKLRQMRAQHASSETTAFRHFRAAARAADPAAVRRAATVWVDRASPLGAGSTLAGFVRAFGDERLGAQAGALDRLLYREQVSDTSAWSPSEFLRGMTEARRRLRRAHQGARLPVVGLLNPGGAPRR